jgi:pimeloyl-ACP methyl ester carboxylesterase
MIPRTTCLLLAAFFILTAQAQAGKEPDASPKIRCDKIGAYSPGRLDTILTRERTAFSDYSATFPKARYAVTLYRITYPSVIPELGNKPTVASGLLAVPEGRAGAMPVVSYQHGTVLSKTEVPSHPDESMETRLMVAQFAGQGYLVVAADYFGKGVSPEPDSYLVKASTQQACLDMLKAAQSASAGLKLRWGPLFLSGWSQGGWSTMVFLNRLESAGIPVRAAATASAPNDLFAILNRWIHAPEAGDASFLPELLALQLNAYERYYGVPGLADSAIKPAYAGTARDLYLNKISGETAGAKLPKKLSELLRDDFMASSSLGETRFWRILQENPAYRWRSKTPLRSYYGTADEVIPPYIATLPVGYQTLMNGAETKGIEVPKANHRGTFVYAVADQKAWFDRLQAE